MGANLELILSACQEQAAPEKLLPLLLRPGATSEVVQHVRRSEDLTEAAGLLERCLQALRRGLTTGGSILSSDGGTAADGDVEADAEEHVVRRLEKATGPLFRVAVEVMGRDGDERELSAYPAMLMDHLDSLTFKQIAALLSDICRGVEGGVAGTPRLLQLLPKAAALLLARVAPEDEAEEDPAAEAGAGPGGGSGGGGQRAPASAAAAHVGAALHRITHADWVLERNSYAVQIMEALRDVPMAPQQAHSVILKALSVCRGCTDLAALPSMLRQLMRLAGLGLHRGLVLRGVLSLFDRLEAQHRSADGRGPSQVLQNVEGTALVIIADAFKYDSALAQELLKSVRNAAVAPSPFCLLLLFTLSRQHKLDAEVMKVLKGLVEAAFKWDGVRSHSPWLSSLPQLPRPGGQQLRAGLLRAVRCSGVGGEVVVPGILSLGAALMGCCPAEEGLSLVQLNEAALAAAEAEAEAEAAARRARRGLQQGQGQLAIGQGQAGGGGAGGRGPAAVSGAACATHGSAGLQSALLGIQLLQAAFEAHREARPDVLRLCQQALGGSAGGAGGAASWGGAGLGPGALAGVGAGAAGGCGLGGAGQELALPAVLLLSNLVARHAALLYEHTPKLKDAFQSFLLLPAPVALGLLLGLWPLARNRRDLSDYLVMLLRKVMFAREAASRLVAVRGFLFILLQQLRAAAGGAAAEDEEQLIAAAAAAAAAAGPSFSQASCSQSSLSQMQALASGAGVSLQHELQGFLRRALGQQAAVRAALYDGLSAVLLADPGSRDVVLELVAPQLYRYVVEGRVMPPLHCKLLVSGASGGSPDNVVLLEPLPSLLACVRRLVALCREAAAAGAGTSEAGGLGLLEEGEEAEDVVMVDEEEGQGTDAAVQTLVRTWDSFARRLLRCEAEHFDLNCAADLNPTTAGGAAKHLQASCIMGAVEVVMEELVGIATGPSGSETAAQTGDRLSRAFELHCRVYELAAGSEVARGPGGRKAKQAATEAAAGSGGDGSGGTAMNGTAPIATGNAGAGGGGVGAPGSKRPREAASCPDLVPAETRPPAMSAGCLGKLCSGVLRDGLATEAAEVEGPDAGPSAHTRLARSPVFQAFVLRSCLNAVRATAAPTGGVLSDALMECAQRRQARQARKEQSGPGAAQAGQSGLGAGDGQLAAVGGGGGGGLEAAWKPMARPLVLLCQTVLTTWAGSVKRPAGSRKVAAAAGAPAAAAAAAAQKREAAAADSLATLAVSCLRDLLGAAAGLGGLEAVAWVLRGLPIHSQDTQAQVDEEGLDPEDVVAARLPHFADMLGRLMTTSSFKEATELVAVVVGLARLLPAAIQKMVSDAIFELMQQKEPLVTSTSLVRALVAAHVTLRGTDDLTALLNVAQHVQEVVGAANTETQQETNAPGTLHEGTAQLAALEVLTLVGAHLGEAEQLREAAVQRAGGAAEEAALGNGGGGAAAGEAGAAAGGGDGGVRPSPVAARSVAQLMEALCRRLKRVLDVLQTVVQTRLGNVTVLEAQVKVLIAAYKLLGDLAKAHLPPKGSAATGPAPPPPALSKAFQEVVALVHRDLTPPVYAAVGEELGGQYAGGGAAGGGEAGEEGAAALRLSRAKLKRDAKAYSQLVHAMENWEKNLLALDKAYKGQGVNLMKGAKRSANRDFQFTARVADGAAARGGVGEDRVERRQRGGGGGGREGND